MDELERSARIRANLGIEPIIHGQIDICQIAIPDSQKQDILPEKRQVLQKSLAEQKTNLVPLIVRRTEAYSELEKYEVVYGADWCIVAKELDIEKLWVWVFDMSDEQAVAAKTEMEQLVGATEAILNTDDENKQFKSLFYQIEKSFDDKMKIFNEKVDRLLESPKEERHNAKTEPNKIIIEQIKNLFEEKVKQIFDKVEQLAESIKKVEAIVSNEEKLKSKDGDNSKKETTDYYRMTKQKLQAIAQKLKIQGRSSMNKNQLIAAITKAAKP